MRSNKRPKHRMFAVSAEGIGIIAGTMAYSRQDAINHLFGGGPAKGEWEAMKRSGYRTVEVCVEIWNRGMRWRGARARA